METNKALFMGFAVGILAIALSLAAAGSSPRDVAIGSHDYVITVPAGWSEERISPGDSMSLHLRIMPAFQRSKGIEGRYGHFTVHVLEANGADREDWIAYHLNKNLPSAHGDFKIEAMEEGRAGSFEAKVLHATRLEHREGYALLEAIVFTGNHVLFMSYLFDTGGGTDAREQMDRILASFRCSGCDAERARESYPTGRTLGLSEACLYLQLPHGWMPEFDKKRPDETVIRLGQGASNPGTLKIYTWISLSSGLKSLSRNLEKRGIEVPPAGEMTSITLGLSAREAFRFEEPAPQGGTVEGVLCLSGRGGFAMILSTPAQADRELFEKMMSRALILDSREAQARYREASNSLKEAIRKGDPAAVSASLTTLSLFSHDRNAALAIRKGLRSEEEAIRLECAMALGRMGSQEASQALESALRDHRTCASTHIACVQALGMIGGAKEKEALIQVRNRLSAKSCPPELVQAVDRTLASFHTTR